MACSQNGIGWFVMSGEKISHAQASNPTDRIFYLSKDSLCLSQHLLER